MAALSGLIFVGLSMNIRTVLEIDKRVGSNFLSGRAAEALVALLNVVVISLVAARTTFRALARARYSASAMMASICARKAGSINRLLRSTERCAI